MVGLTTGTTINTLSFDLHIDSLLDTPASQLTIATAPAPSFNLHIDSTLEVTISQPPIVTLPAPMRLSQPTPSKMTEVVT